MTEVMPTVILAGGLATRMRPLTEQIPKSLIDVGGRPFLWHQLQLLKKKGVDHVVLAVGYLGDRIQQQFGDGSDLGMRIDYSFDGSKLLGTAGAIRQALQYLPENFFVLYGDSYLTCDYQAVQAAFHRAGLPGLMTIYRNEGQYDKSNIEFDGTSIARYDKRESTPQMHYVDYGLGVFQRNVFESIPEGEVRDLATIYQDLLSRGELAAFEVHERFYEIGSPEGLNDTAEFLKSIVESSESQENRPCPR
jgi:NDP-sugar pyrophosphorylase family protein